MERCLQRATELAGMFELGPIRCSSFSWETVANAIRLMCQETPTELLDELNFLHNCHSAMVRRSQPREQRLFPQALRKARGLVFPFDEER